MTVFKDMFSRSAPVHECLIPGKQALELRDEHSIPKSGLIPHTGNFKRLKMAISNVKFQVREKDLP